MRSQIKLGRIFGIEIGLHYSWFLIAFLIVVSLASQFRTANPEWGAATILALAVLTGGLFSEAIPPAVRWTASSPC